MQNYDEEATDSMCGQCLRDYAPGRMMIHACQMVCHMITGIKSFATVATFLITQIWNNNTKQRPKIVCFRIVPQQVIEKATPRTFVPKYFCLRRDEDNIHRFSTDVVDDKSHHPKIIKVLEGSVLDNADVMRCSTNQSWNIIVAVSKFCHKLQKNSRNESKFEASDYESFLSGFRCVPVDRPPPLNSGDVMALKPNEKGGGVYFWRNCG